LPIQRLAGARPIAFARAFSAGCFFRKTENGALHHTITHTQLAQSTSRAELHSINAKQKGNSPAAIARLNIWAAKLIKIVLDERE